MTQLNASSLNGRMNIINLVVMVEVMMVVVINITTTTTIIVSLRLMRLLPVTSNLKGNRRLDVSTVVVITGLEIALKRRSHIIVILEEEEVVGMTTITITRMVEEVMEVSLIEVGMVEGEEEEEGMVDQPIIIKESLTMELVLVELVDLCVLSVKRQDTGPRIAHRRNTE